MSDAQAAQENGVSPGAQVEETPGFKVFAGNLAYTTTDDGLKAFFAPVQADILSAQVIMRGNRPAGYGFVSLTSTEAAQKAVELLDKKDLDGRQVIVEIAKPAEQKERKPKKTKRRTGRRGSKAVPGEVSEVEASGAEAAAPVGGTSGGEDAPKPKKKKKPSRKPKAKPEEGAAAANTSDAAEEGAAAPKKPRTRKPKTPRPTRPVGEDPVGEPSKTVLFVANLGFNIDDEGLAKLFTDASITVASARVVRRRWGNPRKSKGYGFVDVGGEAEQQKAIAALQDKEVDGRKIAVKVAVNTPQQDEKNEGEAGEQEASA